LTEGVNFVTTLLTDGGSKLIASYIGLPSISRNGISTEVSTEVADCSLTKEEEEMRKFKLLDVERL